MNAPSNLPFDENVNCLRQSNLPNAEELRLQREKERVCAREKFRRGTMLGDKELILALMPGNKGSEHKMPKRKKPPKLKPLQPNRGDYLLRMAKEEHGR